jgi:trimeric autotransporter adhesin
VSNLADLTITKTNTPLAGPSDQAADTVASGAQTTYSVVVTNNGPGPAINAVIGDTPGAGLTCAPANVITCTSAAAGACPAGPLTVANLTAGITLGTLPATAGSNTATFSFSCTVQ